jgi:hypothetical protein
MELNPNLVYAQAFLTPIADLAFEVYKKSWSAENRVHYSSRLSALLDAGIEKDFLMTVNPKFVRDFSGTEKCFIYEIIRGSAIIHPELRYIVEDLEQLLNKRGYQNDRYFYLSHLTDSLFSYEVDTKVFKGTPSRRRYYRLLSSQFGKKRLSFREVLEQYFFADIIELNRPRAKKKQRHKGYRDHGSLGSDFSRTLKQQAGDTKLVEDEERRKKEIQDYLDMLLFLRF